MGRSLVDLIIAITLIVVGALLCIGKLGLDPVLPFLGIVLIVLGVLILMGMLPASKLAGIASLIIGILLAVGFFELPREVAQYMWIVNLIAGVILIVLGVQKLIKG